jgi:hypothetical protein
LKIIDVEQGSPEWLQARLGIASASNFSKLITSTGKKSTQLDGYVNTLVAETLMGEPPETFVSEWMLRGTELEAEARAWYEFHTDIDIEQVGFVLRDCGLVGCSPDGLTPSSGLELKCPKAETHVSYLRADKLPVAYIAQVQGCMWVCERDSWDFASYHPLMPKFLITVARDDVFISTLSGLVDELNERKAKALDDILRMAA